MDIFDYFNIRKRRDPHYEGKFYIGAYSMGIFCNVTCPIPPPEDPDEDDLVYLHNIYEGFECGLLPCEECEVDMYADQIVLNRPLSPYVRKAVTMIENGYLDDHTVKELAEVMGLSERYLRKLFSAEVGITPTKLAIYHRGIIAKKFLSETSIPITEVAYSSGFGSLRQFNQVILDMYHCSPSEIRGRIPDDRLDVDTMYIDVDPDFDFASCLNVLKRYEIEGVTRVTEDSYSRSFLINGQRGTAEVFFDRSNDRLGITIHAKDRRCYISVYYRIRRMFDMLNNRVIAAEIIGLESFDGFLRDNALPRLMCWFDPHECMVYSVLRQSCSHDDALRKLSMYAGRRGIKVEETIPGVQYCLPDKFNPDGIDREIIGVDEKTLQIIHALESLRDSKEIYLSYYQSYRGFHSDMNKISGIEEITIQYIARHGLGLKDADDPDPEIRAATEAFGECRSYASLIYREIQKKEQCSG